MLAAAQAKSVAEFYQQNKRKEGVSHFKLPGWLVWIGSGLVYNSVKNRELREFLLLARKFGRLRLMKMEKGSSLTEPDVTGFVKNLHEHDYEDLVYVRDENNQLNFLIKENNDKIKEMVILSKEDDGELTLVSAKTRLKIKDISDLIIRLTQHLPWESHQNTKGKKKKLPQA
jgi:hypothetical protein